MNKDELIQKYALLKDIYGLPPFEELEKEFFISFSIANWRDIPDNVLVFVLNRVADYSTGWINWFHSIINGNPQSMILMRESGFFDDAQKQEMIRAMIRLTVISRKLTIVNLKSEEKSVADMINEIYSVWKDVKPVILKFSELSYDSWLNELDSQPKL